MYTDLEVWISLSSKEKFKYLFVLTIIQNNLGSLKSKTSFMDADKHAKDIENRIKTLVHM